LEAVQTALERGGLPYWRRLAGAWRGRVKIADDFDELPDGLAQSLGMRF
jgi:hypothetical protein